MPKVKRWVQHEAEIAVHEEVLNAIELFPSFPECPYRGLAVIGEEFGELQQAVLQSDYEGGNRVKIRKEAVQLGAMVIRFLTMLPQLPEVPDGR